MARGAAQTQRKQRAKQEQPKRKRSAPAYEQTMFFPRLRRQAKWVFALLAVVINASLIFLVIRPVNQLSKLATDVSMGNSEIAEFPSASKDEIGELSQSFNRMGRSLVEAMKMLRTT